MELRRKLAILADAAKYDASCASSGAPTRNSLKDAAKGAIGSTEGMGICHAYAPDGRCISLLKILLTNFCIYDCSYCINRRTSNVQRARFTVDEVVNLTMNFYKRNYIEGLFLSSGIIQSPDATMELLVQVAKKLRTERLFRGYIHLKTIPDAAPELLAEAGRWADRLSINIELPTEEGLTKLAPEKNLGDIRGAMGRLRLGIDEAKDARKGEAKGIATKQGAPRFAPSGQSTQMIVGADAASDRKVLETSSNLYSNYRLRRVYYSAFSPIPDAPSALPPAAPPLVREHRLYQADWLLRFYGFTVDEITPADGAHDNLALDVDPKTAWALRHREQFPIDLNTAARELLLRVPGLGVKTVDKLIALRRVKKIVFDDLGKLKVSSKKVSPFVVTADHRPREEAESERLRRALAPPVQGGLFSAAARGGFASNGALPDSVPGAAVALAGGVMGGGAVGGVASMQQQPIKLAQLTASLGSGVRAGADVLVPADLSAVAPTAGVGVGEQASLLLPELPAVVIAVPSAIAGETTRIKPSARAVPAGAVA